MRSHLSAALRQQVIADAGHRCGYCLSDETLTGIALTIEHLTPLTVGGVTERKNLWRSCYHCNEFKGQLTHAVDPQNQ
jgi:5-methylcytosine-specific restriction endonuclease McrA